MKKTLVRIVVLLIAGFCSTLSAVPINLFDAPSFEAPILGSGGFVYGPSGAGWTFIDGAGIIANGSPFGAPNAPDGNQAAFLQSQGAMSQVVSTFTPGVQYYIVFEAASRPRLAGNNGGNQTINVSYGSILIGQFSFTSGMPYASYTTDTFTATGTTGTLFFAGASSGDNTAFVDAVALRDPVATPEPSTFGLLFGGAGALVIFCRRRLA